MARYMALRLALKRESTPWVHLGNLYIISPKPHHQLRNLETIKKLIMNHYKMLIAVFIYMLIGLCWNYFSHPWYLFVYQVILLFLFPWVIPCKRLSTENLLAFILFFIHIGMLDKINRQFLANMNIIEDIYLIGRVVIGIIIIIIMVITLKGRKLV